MSNVTNPASATAPLDIDNLFRTEYENLVRFVRRRCSDRATAEDLVAETFASALSTARPTDVTPAWLTVVAKRRLVDHWRRQGRQRTLCERIASAERTVATPDIAPSDTSSEMIARLPDRQRTAVRLRYVDGLPVGDVADRLGLTYQATESLLARARRALAALARQDEHAS